MTSRLTETVIDSAAPAVLADFWRSALGYVVLHAGEDYVEIGPAQVSDADLLEAIRRGPVAPALLFVPVPEPKAGKNRLHLDLTPIDGSQDDEVRRLEGLGARRVDIGQGHTSWVVMADPEGNEFCVLRSLAPGEFALPAAADAD